MGYRAPDRGSIDYESTDDDDMGFYDGDDAGRRDRPARARPRRKGTAGRRAVIAVLGLFVLALLLAILALPFLSVRSDGNAARADLTAALTALRDGRLDDAQVRVASAREHVDSADSAANGLRATILGGVPFAGNAVDDVRRIVVALDEAVSIAELGVDVYPEVLGDDATLVQDGTVDLSALASVTDVAAEVRGHLESARTELDAVGGDTWVVGGFLADARDAALEQIVPLEATIERYQPILDILPGLLGTEGPRQYLVAVMNPAELRASGGTTLSFAPMSFEEGKLTFGEAGNTFDFTDSNEQISWEPVPDNPWHPSADNATRVVNATFSPYWTTSAEELLRAWEVTSGERVDALIAIDLPALADLFAITGPVDVPGYGTLTGDNLVTTLAGSYDVYDDVDERRALNTAIIPLLREKLFEGGRFVQKGQSLLEAADGRHFVVYFRDPEAQAAIADLGVVGDLSATPHDYVGVFTQNTNASKVDFWQQRSISSDVTLHDDGSADVTLTVTIDNDTPPYARPVEDPQIGYFTRWSKPFVATYLPIGAEVQTLTIDGSPTDITSRLERGRPSVLQFVSIEPAASAVLQYTYRVPQAAAVDGETMSYALDVDPQGLVNPAAFNVTVRLPSGWELGELPDGWSEVDGGVRWSGGLESALRLRLSATS